MLSIALISLVFIDLCETNPIKCVLVGRGRGRRSLSRWPSADHQGSETPSGLWILRAVGQVRINNVAQYCMVNSNFWPKMHCACACSRGKFGSVYKCVERSTSRQFAAKLIDVKKPQERKDVENEIELMGELRHPRLLQMYQAFDEGSQMTIIMEL